MEILIIDIWLSKLRYGWEEEIREAILVYLLHKLESVQVTTQSDLK